MPIHEELHFLDLHEFWEYCMQGSSSINRESRSNYNLEWSGGLTWEEAKTMAISGWIGGMEKIEKYRASILPIIASKVLRVQPVYAIAGYVVDVGSYLANQPECFINREFEERNYPGRIYKIVCSIAVSAAISPETIIQRGAMVCALVDAIEYAGHRAEVICNQSTSNRHEDEARKGQRKDSGWFEVSVTVKKASQPLEMTDLAFCLAHPAMFRRMMFSAMEIEGWADSIHAYGYPSEATDQGDIYVNEIFSGTVPDEKAISWVMEELKKLGVDLEEL